MKIPESKILIRFDGMCFLCTKTVRFLLKADQKRKFIFQTLQTHEGNRIPDSVTVIDRSGTYEYFDAVMKIGKELGGIYSAVIIFKLIPQKWRNWLYLFVARNRFRWFGRRSTCYIPLKSERTRFI